MKFFLLQVLIFFGLSKVYDETARIVKSTTNQTGASQVARACDGAHGGNCGRNS